MFATDWYLHFFARKRIINKYKRPQVIDGADFALKERTLRENAMFEITQMPDCLKESCRYERFFQFYRLVDPLTHRVYDCKDGKLVLQSQPCYRIWNRCEACENCTSLRACDKGKECVKLESSPDLKMLVYSIPVSLEGKNLVLESARDISDSLYVEHSACRSDEIGTDLILLMNQSITRDPYTGLYNKVYASQRQAEAGLLSEQGETVAVALFDLDGLKQINDTFGHDAGDRVILQAANELKESAEAFGANAARVGGDEFMLFFRNVASDRCRACCDTVVERLKRYAFDDSKGGVFYADASYGLAVCVPRETGEELFRRADRLMYEQKRSKNPTKER